MQPTAPTPCNTCGMGCRRQARQKTATCCFGFWQQPPTRQTHSAGNCNNHTQTGNCSSHPKLHCHRPPCDPWPVRLELLPESDVAHCQQLHQSPKAHQEACSGASSFLAFFTAMSVQRSKVVSRRIEHNVSAPGEAWALPLKRWALNAEAPWTLDVEA